MKLTKQQQVLGGVMIVGLIAVGVDRLTPRAGAADTDDADTTELTVASTPAAAPANASPTRLFNQKLHAAVANKTTARGAFEAGAAWQTTEQGAPAIDPAGEAFSNAHRLIATLSRGEHSGVVLDGKLCVVGQSIDGFKLLSVSGHTATFSNGHAKVTLNQK